MIMIKKTKLILLMAILVVGGSCVYAQNTECNGTSKVATQGSFTLGYNYSFTTSSNGTDITFTCELLDSRTSVNAYAWTYNPSFAEVGMSLVSGSKYSKTFTGLLSGSLFKVGCKFSYAGGMSVTQTFTYTVGSNCGVIPGAPTLTTTAATSITSTTAISGGNITAQGTSSVAARGVCWSTDTSPTVDLTTKTTDGTGPGVFASNITGLTPGVKYYVRAYATNNAGTNYGSEINFIAPDTESPRAFIATTNGTLSTSVSFLLNATDNSGIVTYTITVGPKPTVITIQAASGIVMAYTVNDLLPATNYSFSITAKDPTGNLAANGPIVLTATTRNGVTSAPVPTVDANSVTSIFSDNYNSINGTLFNPMGIQNTVVSSIQVSGNTTLRYSFFDFEETELGSDLDLSSLGMTNIHFDAWSEDETSLKFSLANRTPDSENNYTVPNLVKEQWNTYDVPLSVFTNQSGFTANSIYKLRFEGSGNSGSSLKTVYIDNIFFWGPPTGLHPISDIENISCFPNPVIDKITISSDMEISQIIVRNLLGQTIKNLHAGGYEKSVDLSSLSTGNYFVTVKLVNGASRIFKCIKL